MESRPDRLLPPSHHFTDKELHHAMPRNGHRRKGIRRVRAHQQQMSDQRLEELREEIRRAQAERRREDEDWYDSEPDTEPDA